MKVAIGTLARGDCFEWLGREWIVIGLVHDPESEHHEWVRARFVYGDPEPGIFPRDELVRFTRFEKAARAGEARA